MDRNATVLYLQNVRDLEVARYKLKMRYQQERIQYDWNMRNAQASDYWALPEEPYLDGGFAFLAVLSGLETFLGILFSIMGDSVILPAFFGFAAVLFDFITLIRLINYISDKQKYKVQLQEVKQHNAEEAARDPERQAAASDLQQKWNARQQWYQEESARLEDLLDSFYNMNVLPVQFRTLPAVCYIYDYMSTSRETLTTALFDQHLEDGIQRLEAKLSQLIDQLDEVVYQTRCIRENSERAIAQNNRMLSSLRRTEANSLEAAHYAELSANYSKANAYFSLADYLND